MEDCIIFTKISNFLFCEDSAIFCGGKYGCKDGKINIFFCYRQSEVSWELSFFLENLRKLD